MHVLPQGILRYATDPLKFETKPYRMQLSKRMEVGEFKSYLIELIQQVVSDSYLPARLSKDCIAVFLLNEGTSFEDVHDLLKQSYKSTYSFVEHVVIPATVLHGNNQHIFGFEIKTIGSTLVVEIKSSFAFKLRTDAESESDQSAMNIETRPKPLVLSYPDKSSVSINGLAGLVNIGNTCYMNSALQCLVHIPELAQLFLSRQYKKDINLDNPLGSNGRLVESFASLMFEAWNGSKSSFPPSHFKLAMAKFNNTVASTNISSTTPTSTTAKNSSASVSTGCTKT